MVKDIICLIQGRNLFDSNKYLFGPKIFCLNQTNFVSLKQNISLHQRKCFKEMIFLIQSNIFSECKNKISAIKTFYFWGGALEFQFLSWIGKEMSVWNLRIFNEKSESGIKNWDSRLKFKKDPFQNVGEIFSESLFLFENK